MVHSQANLTLLSHIHGCQVKQVLVKVAQGYLVLSAQPQKPNFSFSLKLVIVSVALVHV